MEDLVSETKPHHEAPANFKVLIAKADLLYGDCLAQAIRSRRPDSVIEVVTRIKEGRRSLNRFGRCDLFVCGVVFRDGDALDWLAEVSNSGNARRILVVTARRELRVHLSLRQLEIHGIFNAFEGGFTELQNALSILTNGGSYVSESFRDLSRMSKDSDIGIFKKLSLKEQLVLSVIGDGSDDIEAGERLKMTSAAVRSHRKRIHIKLGVSHRGELMRAALQNGFVRVDVDQIIRPGFSQLMKQVSQSPFAVANTAP